MTEQKHQAQSVFLNALEISAERERAAFLEAHCGADRELRQEVDELLDHARRLGQFLDPGEAGTDAMSDHSVTEQPGATIGPYKLLQQIGEGGMGVVYMANQTEPVRRQVALKIIKLGMDSKQVVARFEAEQQALSLMDHPNIAKVIDASTTDAGRPYFVMELVKGQPITEYCDQHQLTPRQRLELLLPVCQAVQHAHQKGVIHRDIKPSNILVAEYDEHPVPKVIDFGVAKAVNQPLTEKTMFTALGQIVGTLEYMSPEQAKVNQRDVDTRTDVYALGVVLYELLTGTTPFDKQRLRAAAWDEMLRIIREEEPPKPSTRLSSSETLASVAANRHIEPAKLSALVRGELDWIVMKTLEKDRARRYDMASALAADIGHYLHDEPVVACPPSARYRFDKFARRNKVAMLTTALVAASLLAGLLGTSWQAIRATRAEHTAIVERDQKEAARREALTSAQQAKLAARAERQAREAEAQQRQTAEAAEKMAAEEAAIAQAVNAFVNQDLLGRADPHSEPNRDLKVREVLDRAAQNITGRFDDQPLVEAAIRMTIGNSYSALGEYDEAERQLQRAQELRRQHLGDDHAQTLNTGLSLTWLAHDRGEYQQAQASLEQIADRCRRILGEESLTTIAALEQLGQVDRQLGRFDEALSLATHVIELRRKIQGPEHPDTLTSMSNLASALKDAGHPDQALPLHEQTLALRRKVLGPHHPGTLTSMSHLVEAYAEAAQYGRAIELGEQCLELNRKILGPEHPYTLMALDSLANAYQYAGQHDRSIELCEQALALMRKVQGPEHPHTLTSITNLAAAYQDAGQYDKALELDEQALALNRKIRGPEHPSTLTTMNNLVVLYHAQGRYAEAESLCTQIVEIQRRVLGPEHPDTLSSLNNLAAVYLARSKYAEAEPILTQVLDIQRRVLGPEHPETLTTMGNLAMSYKYAGQYDKALELHQQTLELKQKVRGPEHPETLTSMDNLAKVYVAAGQYDKALELHQQTLELFRKVRGPEHADTLTALGNLAQAYGQVGQLDKALALHQQTWELKRKVLGPEHPGTLKTMSNLATAYVDTGRLADAESLGTGLLAIQRRTLSPDDLGLANTLALLGQCLIRMGRSPEAEALLRECLAIREEKIPEAWQSFSAKSLLGECLSAQGKHEEAERLLISAYQGLRARADTWPARERTRRLSDALQRLMAHYESVSRPEEVDRWQAELQQVRSAESDKQTAPQAASSTTEEEPAKPNE